MTPTTEPTPAGADLPPDLIARLRQLSPADKQQVVGLLLDDLDGPPPDPAAVKRA